MLSYIKHKQKYRERSITEEYSKCHSYIQEFLEMPLRKLTYECEPFEHNFKLLDASMLAGRVDEYIHDYNVDWDKDVTFGTALGQIIEPHLLFFAVFLDSGGNVQSKIACSGDVMNLEKNL